MRQSPRALLAVSDKRDLVDFARGLLASGYELIATGETYDALRAAGLAVSPVSAITGHPELFGGRVKTLDPRILGSILMRREQIADIAQADAEHLTPIDMVVVNLDPFGAAASRPTVTVDEAIDAIDIEGAALLCAAAKNHPFVTVVCDPADYASVSAALAHGGVPAEARRLLALKAFQHTASYDAGIMRYLDGVVHDTPLPTVWYDPLTDGRLLRYGENPHQAAMLYHRADELPLGGAALLQGKPLSYNNVLDLDAASALLYEFQGPVAVIIKHANPSGVGRDETHIGSAYERALQADPVSAYGGVLALNRPVEASLAQRLLDHFFEVIAAPAFEPEARALLATRTALRLVMVDPASLPEPTMVRSTRYGTLVQTPDPPIGLAKESWQVVTRRAPTPSETLAMHFLWRVVKHVKSNAVVLGDSFRTFGVGAGQMSRVDAAALAITKSTGELVGASMASDAFFPFADGLEVAAKRGISAVIQPGGSKRDREVIDAANAFDIAMVFTGTRHFRH